MRILRTALAGLALFTHNLFADTVSARCDIYPKGSDHIEKMLPCDFSQRQGFIHIIRSDGIEYTLRPKGDRPGNYLDDRGRTVYRQSGLGKAGHIYRLADESVYVYWDTSALYPTEDENSLTYPFSTRDFRATSLFRCKSSHQSEMQICPAGIQRYYPGKADIHVKLPDGNIVVLMFDHERLDIDEHDVSWKMKGDTWQVLLDNSIQVDVPAAAIDGG